MDRYTIPSAELKALHRRAVTVRTIREFFDRRGFLEVDTPVLSRDTVVDRYLGPIPVDLPTEDRDDSPSRSMWLQTSPEFAMKRLLASGATAIYQLAHAFRIGERGDYHNPEFTLVEWYRVGDDQGRAIRLLGELAGELFGCDRCDQVDYRTVFIKHAQVDPFAATDVELANRVTDLETTACPGATDRDSLLNVLMADLVQPHLGREVPVIVHDFPPSQAALAGTAIRDYGAVAERFELFFQGVELANGYHELTNADELVNRNLAVNRQRAADGNKELPVDSRLVDAMRTGLPPCAGVALGLDRVVMLQLGAKSIDEVIAFPIDRA